MSKSEMTPFQCKEHIDELLEMQIEEAELKRKADKAQEVYKDAKAKHELKSGEILQMLQELNQELPLFDRPEDVPFPFPLPEGTHEATLGNVAVDPVVLGLTVGIVKHVRETLAVFTLGELEKYCKAEEPLSPEKQQKVKIELGKKLGQTPAVKLLRAVASFTGSRKKQPAKKAAAAVPAPQPVKAAARTTAAKPADFRETLCADVEELTPAQAQFLGQLELTKVGQVLDKLDAFMKEAPSNGPKDYLARRFAGFLASTPAVAKAIIDGVYSFEEKYLTGEK